MSRRPEHVTRVVVGALAGVALAEVAWALFFPGRPAAPRGRDLLDTGLNALAALLTAWLSLRLAWRAGATPFARPLAAAAALLAVWHGFAVAAIRAFATFDPRSSDLVFLGGLAAFLIPPFLALGALLRFAALFPAPIRPGDPERYSQAHPGRWGPRLRRANLRLTGAFLSPAVVWSAAVLIPLGAVGAAALARAEVPYAAAILGLWTVLAPVFPVLGVSAGVFLLRIGYHAASPDDRKRVLWILWGATTSAGLVSVSVAATLLSSLVWFADTWIGRLADAPLLIYLPLLVVELSLAVAVLYRGDIDPRLAIQRTTVYGALGVTFLFLFEGFGNAAEGLLESSLGLPAFTGSVVTGGTLAVVLIPVKRRLDGAVNRLLPPTLLAETPTQALAILFSDVVGFTALTGADHKTGLTVMSVFHKAADRVAREHRGRFVKAVADEVILEFRDPEDAARAGLELQGEFHDSARRLDLPTPEICTGIHYGEAARSPEGDLFGSAVNIASRVQGVAGPGQVVVSGAVRARLTPGAFASVELGPQRLKNVADPVECHRLLVS